MLADCLTEVRCESTDSYGSGYLLKPDLVLTACHVIDDSGQDLPADIKIWVRPYAVWQAKGDWLPATLVWPPPADWLAKFGQDIALLRIMPNAVTERVASTPDLGGRDLPVLQKVRVAGAGFPAFKAQGNRRDTFPIYGEVPTLADLKAQQWNVEYTGSRQPEREEDWSGISGAALFAQGRLIGVISRKVRNETDFRPGIKDFTAVRIDPALEEKGFTNLIYGPCEPGQTEAAQVKSRLALVIGVSEHQSASFAHLRFAANDADEMHRFLSKAHYSIDATPLTNKIATRERILRALDNLRKECARCRASGVPNPTVLIYFSGHGAIDETGRSYLVPHDARRDDLFATALWSKYLDSALDELRTSRLVVFLDACHAEAVVTKGVPADPSSFIPEKSGRYIVASCMAGQNSYEDETAKHGLFTGKLLELLRSPQEFGEKIELWDLYGKLKKKILQRAAALDYTQEPFANFEQPTDVVLAINEFLRERPGRLGCLNALLELIVPPDSEKPGPIPHDFAGLIEQRLRTYVDAGSRTPGFESFFRYFDEVCRNFEKASVDDRLDYARGLARKFEECRAQAATAGRTTGMPSPDALPPVGGAGAPATIRPQAAGQQPSEARDKYTPAAPNGAGARPQAPSATPASAIETEPSRRLTEADADYVLCEIINYPQLFREMRELRNLLIDAAGTSKPTITRWLVDTTTTRVEEAVWNKICDGISERFTEKWPAAQEVVHTSLLSLRAGGSE